MKSRNVWRLCEYSTQVYDDIAKTIRKVWRHCLDNTQVYDDIAKTISKVWRHYLDSSQGMTTLLRQHTRYDDIITQHVKEICIQYILFWLLRNWKHPNITSHNTNDTNSVIFAFLSEKATKEREVQSKRTQKLEEDIKEEKGEIKGGGKGALLWRIQTSGFNVSPMYFFGHFSFKR